MTIFTKLGTAALIATTLAPLVVSATTVEDVIAEMKAKGYTHISVEKSLLGRTEIEGKKDGVEREVVLSSSGKILRDEIEMEDDDDENHEKEYNDDKTSSDD
jgi:hypothetical protein